MTENKSRREVIQMTLSALATRSMWLPTGLGVVTSLTACGGGGESGSPVALGTPAAPASGALTISTSNVSPTALTPVALTVAGLDFNSAFTVTLSTASDASVPLPPVRVSSATNLIVIAMPLYIDPTSGATAPLTASVTITQGINTSNALTLNIADLPSVASYGVNPGDLSRGLLNAQSVYFGMNLNALQAMGAVNANTNTSSVQKNISALQVATIQARADIDAIVSGAQTSLNIGSLSDGTTVAFNASSVDVMDRMVGLYLQAVGLLPSTVYSTPTSVSQPSRKMRRRRTNGSGAGSIISLLGTATGTLNLLTAQTSTLNSTNGVDKFIAVGQGTTALVGIFGVLAFVAGAPSLLAAATVVGAGYGLLAMVNDWAKWYTQSLAVDAAIQSGDAAALAQAQTAVAAAKTSFAIDTIDTAFSVFESVGAAGDVAETFATLVAAQSGGDVGIAAVHLIDGVLSYVETNNGSTLEADSETMDASNAYVPGAAGSFGLANGQLTGLVDDGSGTQINGVELSAANSDLTTAAGTDGNYSLIVPLNVSAYEDSAMDLGTYDIATSLFTPPTSVNLIGLTNTAPVDLPPIPAVSDGSTTCTSGQVLPATMSFTLTSDNTQCGTNPIPNCGDGGNATVTITDTTPTCSGGVVGSATVTVDGVVFNSVVVLAQVMSSTLIQISFIDSVHFADPSNPSYPGFTAFYNYGTGSATIPNIWDFTAAAQTAGAVNDDGGPITLN
jgi:hypothetical protein